MATLKLENISDNLLSIIDELLSNSNIRKYLYHSSTSPLDEADVEADTLWYSQVFPFPFDEEPRTKEEIQLRVYYPVIDINNKVYEKATVQFDIITPKTQKFWMAKVNGKTKIRPYQIMHEIVNELWDKEFGIGGKLVFKGKGRVMNTNSSFNQLTFFAEMGMYSLGSE